MAAPITSAAIASGATDRLARSMHSMRGVAHLKFVVLVLFCGAVSVGATATLYGPFNDFNVFGRAGLALLFAFASVVVAYQWYAGSGTFYLAEDAIRRVRGRVIETVRWEEIESTLVVRSGGAVQELTVKTHDGRTFILSAGLSDFQAIVAVFREHRLLGADFKL